MNRIDPDDEEDEEGGTGNGDPNSSTTTPVKKDPTSTPSKNGANFATPSKPASRRKDTSDGSEAYTPAGPGRHEPARSSHQPHQQAFLKYQQQQQQQQQQMQNNQKDLQPRSRSTRAAAVAATAAVSTSNNSGGGNMVLDPETGEMVPAGSDGEENYEDEEYEDEDDVQVIQSAKPVLINLGQLKNSSSSSSTSKNNLQVCVWSLVIFLFFNLF